MPVQRESFKRIKSWIKNYRKSKFHIRETNSVVIDLNKIRRFLAYIDATNRRRVAEKQINGIRFYLVRQNDYFVNHSNDGTDQNNTREIVFRDNTGTDQTQISLLGLPVINYHVKCVNENHPNTPHTLLDDCLGEFVGYDEGLEDAIAAASRGNDVMMNCLYAASNQSEHTGLCPYNCDGTMDGEL